MACVNECQRLASFTKLSFGSSTGTEADQVDLERNWLVKRDIQDMKLTWREAEELAADESKWRRRVIKYCL